MKKSSKKGFTLVELVIVIAVIAILSAVLIPTFSGIQQRAKESAAMQEAKSEYESYLAEYANTLTGDEDYVVKSGDYWFAVKDGQFETTAYESEEEAKSAAGITATTKSVDLSLAYEKVNTTSVTAPVSGTQYYTYSETDKKYVTTSVSAWAASTNYYTQYDLGSSSIAIYEYTTTNSN